MEHRAGHELVRRQQIGEDSLRRAVVLRQKSHQEVLVELIRRLRVEDVDAVDLLARRDAIETHGTDVDVLRKVLVWLEVQAQPRARLATLERIIVVIDRIAAAVSREHAEPSEWLQAAKRVNGMGQPEPLTAPRLVAVHVTDADETLPRGVEANAGVNEVFVAAL